MAAYGWIFMLSDHQAEIFASAYTLRTILILFCVAAVVLLCIISYLIIAKMLRPMKAIDHSLIELKNLNITEKEMMRSYSGRSDEIGTISTATESLTKCHRNPEQLGRSKRTC